MNRFFYPKRQLHSKCQSVPKLAFVKAIAAFIASITWLLFVSQATADTLTFNTQTFPPFTYLEEGEVSGPGTQIVKMACEQAKIDCHFFLLPWKRAQHEVQEGKVNGMYLIGRNAARLQWLHYSPPLIKTGYAFFVKQENRFNYTSINDFSGHLVSVKENSNTHMSLEKVIKDVPNIGIDGRNTDMASFEKLLLNRVQAVFINTDVANSYIRSHNYPVKNAFTLKSLNYYVGLSLEHTPETLRERFMSALIAYKASGDLNQYLKNVNLIPVPPLK